MAWENAKHHHEQRTEHKSCTKPEEIRNFPNGNVELLTFSGAEVGPLVFEPGWHWSRDIEPLAKTASREAPHFQYHVSGRLAIRQFEGELCLSFSGKAIVYCSGGSTPSDCGRARGFPG